MRFLDDFQAQINRRYLNQSTMNGSTNHVKYDSQTANPIHILIDCTSEDYTTFQELQKGIRHKLPDGVKRHEWKEGHGYRKYFKSRAEQVMRPANVEILMGHDLGISQSYWLILYSFK